VSGRGGKLTTTTSPSRQSYQPLAYEPIVPPQQQQQGNNHQNPLQNIGMRGMVPKETFSGAAAAAVKGSEFQEPFPPDTAFGRQFHPPEILTSSGNDSLISGLSNPTTVLSGVSDPMSSVSLDSLKRSSPQHQAHFLRLNQLQQLRQQFTTQQASGTTTTPTSLTSVGMGSSLMRSYSGNLDWSGRSGEDMSWAEHSLAGGGIREASMASTGQQQQNHHSNNSDRTTSTRSTTRHKTSDVSRERAISNMSDTRDRTTSQDTVRDRTISNMSASIASMSINSGGSSLPGSILSDMSESLLALDLAEPRLLDQFGEL